MTVFARGIDYAWAHPDPGAIAAAGYAFACRYLSRDASKNLTLAEAQALAAHGVWCVANWEYTAQDMLRGYAGGIADAQLALAQAKAAGMPDGRPIYFSADWDVTPEQEATLLAYLSGAASVLGHGHVGEYGGYYPIKTARDSGTVWTWQSAAWSGGQWDARDTVRQTGAATVGGVDVDVNQAMVADYGQWQPGRLPDIVEADMPLTPDEINAVANAAKDAITNIPRGVVVSPHTGGGQSSIGAEILALPTRFDALNKTLAALSDKVSALAAPVDVKALAASVVTALGPIVQQAVASGVQPDYDHMAVVLEAHLAATLAAAPK